MATMLTSLCLLFLALTVQMFLAIPLEEEEPPPIIVHPPLPPKPAGCRYDGKYYPVGSFQPDPCTHCYCTDTGETPCAIMDCFYIDCADAVKDPNQCCKTCPNGPNCRAPDGHIIAKGDTYEPNPYTSCSCPEFPSPNNEAECDYIAVEEEPPQTAVLK